LPTWAALLGDHRQAHEWRAKRAALVCAWRRSRSASKSPEPPHQPELTALLRAPIGIAADARRSGLLVSVSTSGETLSRCPSGATRTGPCWVSVSQLLRGTG